MTTPREELAAWHTDLKALHEVYPLDNLGHLSCKYDETGTCECVTLPGRLKTHVAAHVEAALAEQAEGIAAAIHDYADAVWDLIDSPNGARLAFEKIEDIARTYTQEAGK